jgi:glycerophosphoryl diester phosphodiesterase
LARITANLPVENTLAAFEYALMHGCDGFEFDVRHTRDGRNVLWHDPEYNRLPIVANNYADLADRQGNRLPCFEDVLQQFGSRAYLDIELKVGGAEPLIVAALTARPPQRGFIVSSFLPDVLQSVHGLNPAIPLGFICDSAEMMPAWHELPIRVLLPHDKLVSRRLISEVHERSREIMTWTVNTRARMLQLADWSIDGIISDDPELLYQTFHNR